MANGGLGFLALVVLVGTAELRVGEGVLTGLRWVATSSGCLWTGKACGCRLIPEVGGCLLTGACEWWPAGRSLRWCCLSVDTADVVGWQSGPTLTGPNLRCRECNEKEQLVPRRWTELEQCHVPAKVRKQLFISFVLVTTSHYHNIV